MEPPSKSWIKRTLSPRKYISEILSEEEGSYKACRRICDELDVTNHGSNDYEIIRQVCHIVTERSAAIVAAAISALLRHINRENIKIGVGGALIQFHPTYHELLEAQLNQLAPLNVHWELVAADEGSAKGGRADGRRCREARPLIAFEAS
ncbi:Phosphotransferase [Aphelenchoides fujianensis]|nr:Phosphotransferase [Aphelenchoides fujianensis]